MSKDTIKFFVYGTLRVGGHFAEQFNGVRISSTPAKIKGDLFQAGGFFPGIALGGDNDVYGEVHEYSDADGVKAAMDGIEGYSEGRKNNLFNRKEVEATTRDGETIKAFVYEYGKPNDLRKGGGRIESGKWEVKGLAEIESF